MMPAQWHPHSDLEQSEWSGNRRLCNPNAAVTTASFSTAGSYVLSLTASDSALRMPDRYHYGQSCQPGALRERRNKPSISLPSTANLSGVASDDGRLAAR
jgi:hypothetical protein